MPVSSPAGDILTIRQLSVAPASRDKLLEFMTSEAALDADVDRDELFRSIRERELFGDPALIEKLTSAHTAEEAIRAVANAESKL